MQHIYLCECILKIFIAWTYCSHPWLWPAYIKSRFAIFRTVKIKGLCLQLKRSRTKYAAKKNHFFNISSCKWPPTSYLKSFTSFWRGIDELLPIYFFIHQHVQHMTSQILLILIDFDRIFYHFLIWNYSSLNRYNSGTGSDIKKTVNCDLPDFCCFFKFGNKKKHLHFKYFN